MTHAPSSAPVPPASQPPVPTVPAAPTVPPVPAVPVVLAGPDAVIPPGWLLRAWPRRIGGAPGRAVIGTALATVIAGWVLVPRRPGLGWLIVAIGIVGCGVVAAWRTHADEQASRRLERSGWSFAAVALVAIGAIRADGELFAWCVCAAIGCGSIAVAGGRTFRGLVAGSGAIVVAAGRAIPWWCRGAAAMGRRCSGGIHLGRTVIVSIALLVVFGSLFATADPEFAHLITSAVPTWSVSEMGRTITALFFGGGVAGGIAYLASGRPPFHHVGPLRARPVRRAEWAVPLTVLDGLSLAFVLVQLATLFGGRQRVLATAGLTYAQYARSGFWQLLVVAGLTLIVIAVAAGIAPRVTRADRVLLRLLLGTLAALTLVIVASALQRLAVYDSAYGYTRLRLAVGVTEMWLGLVFVLVLVAGVRLRAAWLPRVVAATAVLTLLATAIVGPDAFVAARDVDRFQRTGHVDLTYLASLSADAVPALERLPAAQRSCVLVPIHTRQSWYADDWRSWNLGRSRARGLLDVPFGDGGIAEFSSCGSY